MSSQAVESPRSQQRVLDALVIGAGFSGLAMMAKLRELKMTFRVIEAGSDVGGTWYWNRYPGARTDSEGWYYCFSSDKALLDDWRWSERYPSQPEVHRYLRHVAERYDYRPHITFNCKMERAQYQSDENDWLVHTSSGEDIRAKFLISGMGVLSEPYLPKFRGVERFRGEWYRTALWPKLEPDFRGKRVAVIGTGATGVQLIPIVAKQAAQVTVFQRTANYVIPAQNHPLSDEQTQNIKANYEGIWRQVRGHPFAMPFSSSGRNAVDATNEEREAAFEEGWRRGGFRYLFETYDDLLISAEANKHAADFIRQKIRSIVKDPKTAELLCPRDHPYGSKRPPGGHEYYEAYNRENVTLVDVKKNVIDEITESGIRLQDGTHYQADVIIFATGFDGYTGAFTAIDIVGEEGHTLREHWRDGPRTYLGLAVSGFPNLFLVNGPTVPFSNNPPIIEKTADSVARLLDFVQARRIDVVDVLASAEETWIKALEDAANATLVPLAAPANNWLMGANIPGKKLAILMYLGGLVQYSILVDREAQAGYPNFVMKPASSAAPKRSREAATG